MIIDIDRSCKIYIYIHTHTGWYHIEFNKTQLQNPLSEYCWQLLLKIKDKQLHYQRLEIRLVGSDSNREWRICRNWYTWERCAISWSYRQIKRCSEIQFCAELISTFVCTWKVRSRFHNFNFANIDICMCARIKYITIKQYFKKRDIVYQHKCKNIKARHNFKLRKVLEPTSLTTKKSKYN